MYKPLRYVTNPFINKQDFISRINNFYVDMYKSYKELKLKKEKIAELFDAFRKYNESKISEVCNIQLQKNESFNLLIYLYSVKGYSFDVGKKEDIIYSGELEDMRNTEVYKKGKVVCFATNVYEDCEDENSFYKDFHFLRNMADDFNSSTDLFVCLVKVFDKKLEPNTRVYMGLPSHLRKS